jgi:outer membrane protein assembly factor BamB
MSAEITYLELSESAGSHKFYELTLDGVSYTVRFGRIGDKGQSKTTTCDSAEIARTESRKKIAEKTKKGYSAAVIGGRAKRAVTRRVVESHKSSAKQSPVLWKFGAGSDRAFGIFVDEHFCWMGNEGGFIYALSHDGVVRHQFKLPDGVKCIVADNDWLYAGCDDGNVYDLGSKVPRVAYAIAEDIDIFWLDIKDGVLGVSDAAGNVVIVNHEDESQWRKNSGARAGWMVRCDELGVYHGHSNGVTMYDWEDGTELWSRKTSGPVMFGWQEESAIFACTNAGKVHRFSKRGEGDQTYDCDASVLACAAAEDGKYVFAADNSSSIYCFNAAGERLWRLATGCGSALSMQYFRERLYIVTIDGSLACIDASESAIEAAKVGTVPQAKTIATPKPVALAPAALETTSETGSGVVVECVDVAGQIRVRVVSAGFETAWFVQFPKELRVAGARYVVQEVRTAARGGFYRAHGDIQRLLPG